MIIGRWHIVDMAFFLPPPFLFGLRQFIYRFLPITATTIKPESCPTSNEEIIQMYQCCCKDHKWQREKHFQLAYKALSITSCKESLCLQPSASSLCCGLWQKLWRYIPMLHTGSFHKSIVTQFQFQEQELDFCSSLSQKRFRRHPLVGRIDPRQLISA